LKKAQVLSLTIDTVNPLLGRAEALDGLFPGNRSEYFWLGVQAKEPFLRLGHSALPAGALG
jgi:hypothetical protein